ncbi:hypothetical protein O6H91_Y188800 [Diphasiastrum complanatum]|nr:hypothetical protein O6H91_Y188800 [Diphasiastrum complanatum]
MAIARLIPRHCGFYSKPSTYGTPNTPNPKCITALGSHVRADLSNFKNPKGISASEFHVRAGLCQWQKSEFSWKTHKWLGQGQLNDEKQQSLHPGKGSTGSWKAGRVRAQLTTPLIGASDTWGTWTVLLSAGAFGIWSEKTSWGSTLSGALVSTLAGLLASNVGLISSNAPAYVVVNTYLLPLAVPLLLYAADMRRVLSSTGKLLVAFCIGTVATIIGTFVAMRVVPLSSLGPDGWKIASALMSRHIGGAVNYVAVSEALGTSSTMVASGLAADNLICAIYFTTLFTLASSIPPEASQSESSGEEQLQRGMGSNMQLLEGSIGLALSAAICMSGVGCAKFLRIHGGGIPCITAIVVLLATIFPTKLGRLAPSGESLAAILLQAYAVQST